MNVYDVIVVGAGPGGSALSNALARDGYRALLLEKSHFPRPKVCGDLVSAKCLVPLEELGCANEIAQKAYVPIEWATVFLNGREFSRHRTPRVPGLPPHGYTLPRLELDEILFRSAQSTGAETIQDCSVVDFYHDKDCVRVRARVRGRSAQFAGRILVGADGVQSTVARISGLSMEDSRYINPAMRAYCHGLPVRETLLWFDEDYFPGYGWILPIRENVSNVGVGIVKESLTHGGLNLRDFYSRLRSFVEHTARDFGAHIELEKPVGWTIKTYGGARKNYFERGLLIGDAGSFVDPISGEGIHMALETAQIAREVIHNAFERGDFSAASLAEYEERWRRHCDAGFKVADLAISLARNRHFRKLWLHSIKIMGMTAAEDEEYALTLGGIMAGIVPATSGLTPDVLFKSLVHDPGFWMRAYDVAPHQLFQDLAIGGLRLTQWQVNVMRETLADLEWSSAWFREVQAKWLDAMDTVMMRRT